MIDPESDCWSLNNQRKPSSSHFLRKEWQIEKSLIALTPALLFRGLCDHTGILNAYIIDTDFAINNIWLIILKQFWRMKPLTEATVWKNFSKGVSGAPVGNVCARKGF